MMAKTKMVVGLGNPGKTYQETRHNIGYQVINELEKLKLPGIFLYKPPSLMNQSGPKVAEKARKLKVLPQELLVICDDFSLPCGYNRFRLRGSSGGHKGLDSIIQSLRSSDFPRLRVGIGPVPADKDPADFVLERPALTKEMLKIGDAINGAIRFIRQAVEIGLERATSELGPKKP